MSAAIKVEDLGKSYMVGHRSPRSGDYKSFREEMVSQFSQWGRKTRDLFSGRPILAGDEVEEFWALKGVNFEISHGERVGIIGRNGAGKSTLLKILSRITEPTTGSVEMNGRVASLLEVGTGFHPELTGRENIFLNGAILGMSRRQIQSKFDEIVAFAEVEKFLDTPVKRYSSGMYVRLAFSVAAHLEPEILVVDEVLAVGDVEFQKKCLGKMQDVSGDGRTVLFVSHNMGAIRQLCSRGIVLEAGSVAFAGNQNEAADYYLRSSMSDASSRKGSIRYAEDADKSFQILGIDLIDRHGEANDSFDCDAGMSILIDCISRHPVPGLYGYLALLNQEGIIAWESDSMDRPPNHIDNLRQGRHAIRIDIPPRTLGRGRYSLSLSFASNQSFSGFILDDPQQTPSFTMLETGTLRGDRRNGFLSTLLTWRLESRTGQD